MREKLEMTKNDVMAHMQSTWTTYASQTYKGKRLIFKIRMDGLLKVQYDGLVVYRGENIWDAVEAWEGVK